jgi:hypothetical protein
MMIYLSNFLQQNNNLQFHTLSYSKNIFSDEKINFEVNDYSKNINLKFIKLLLIAFKIRNSDYIII